MGHVLAIRPEHTSLFRQGAWSNRPLFGAVALTVALQMVVIYAPLLAKIMRTHPLSAAELARCLALSSVVFVGVELEKWLIRCGWLYTAGERAASAWRPSSVTTDGRKSRMRRGGASASP